MINRLPTRDFAGMRIPFGSNHFPQFASKSLGSGTTATVVIVAGRIVTTAAVGDSLAVFDTGIQARMLTPHVSAPARSLRCRGLHSFGLRQLLRG